MDRERSDGIEPKKTLDKIWPNYWAIHPKRTDRYTSRLKSSLPPQNLERFHQLTQAKAGDKWQEYQGFNNWERKLQNNLLE
jgi:hypothetical protein